MRRIALCAVAASAACTDPEVKCESVQLSMDSATVFFREPVTVSATPRGHLGTVIGHNVTWSSSPGGIVDIVPTSPDGSIAELRPKGIGAAVVVASCANATKTFAVTVPDTAYSVSVTPSSATLVVGDTITLTALVNGPPAVDSGVRWRVPPGATVAFLTSPDSPSVRIQIIGTTPGIVARARADSTKSGTSSLTGAPSHLTFVVQPSNVNKGHLIGPAIQVAIQNSSGVTSPRSAITVTLGPATNGSCNPATRLSGRITRPADGGVARFDSVRVDRSGDCALIATASAPASSATSSAFTVGFRDCAPVPYMVNDTISTIIEATDCKVTRNGSVFYVHRYAVTHPSGGNSNLRSRLTLTSSFGPRVESSLWAPDTNNWVDSASAPGTFTQHYDFGIGTHTISVSSRSPGGTGDYVFIANSAPSNIGTNNGCLYLSSRATTKGFPGSCPTEFLSRGTANGRRFLFYLPAGATTTITVGPQDPSVDPYLEVVEVVGGLRALIEADDNSGGGLSARVAVSAAPVGRWLEAVGGLVSGIGSLTITIP